MTEAQAFQAYGERARVARLPLAKTDRARCAGQTGGFVKLLAAPRRLLGTTGGGRLVGMTVVGPAGGELVAEGALAIRTARSRACGRLAQTVHAYPTWSTAIRQAAAQWLPEATDTTARPARPPNH
jgi:pyruvate/2-oxoglutarate dehydrogenase complex dihydrolipoamide dehydrogenase (E3) component